MARQKDSELRTQGTYKIVLQIGMLGMGIGRIQPSHLPTETSEWCSASPSIIGDRYILYCVKGEIKKTNKMFDLFKFFCTFYFFKKSACIL